ncbi:hypothetical protein RchiOBHm_Chr3g0456061 [Rosa chinensis]|uniref:Uncharacterized protein n=1 Tax=Rosa chinensis TaxID=74649 RepID=A0A2P6R779_ROSCH|nr:hypothetical protein RchiOBHm_Chr7g0198731 [Rosa chinensis]PRQ42293.1 hypothetical protein RchiOBHm_Chr3g0456061 [Rosa chinensis]
MNNAQARSSTHYDPHHNLLCLVSGCKQGQIIFSNLLNVLGCFQLHSHYICLYKE